MLEKAQKTSIYFLQAHESSKNMDLIFCKRKKNSKNMDFFFCKLKKAQNILGGLNAISTLELFTQNYLI